jgi:hypothetical protein
MNAQCSADLQVCPRAEGPGLTSLRRRLSFLQASAIAALVLVVLTATTQAQGPTLLTEQEFHGRSAWVIENGTIRVTLIQAGGHIGEVRLLGGDPQLGLNPMYVPPGTGYVGHLVCFPYYGPASPDERQHGLRGHGEAGSVEWRETTSPRIEAETLTFFYGADLPQTQYRIERAVTVRTGEAAVHVEEWIENLAAYDRPYNWNQHATFGAPFVAPERNVLDMSGAAALTDARRTGGGQWSAGAELRWPDAPRPDGTTVSLREFRARPDGQVYTAVRTTQDLGWFTLYNPDHRLLVGYLFPAADHPWIIDWQNQPEAWSPAGVARGIQFGTSPFDEGLRRSVERGQLFGVPTYRWIAAGQRLSTTYTIFLAAVPPDFAGSKDVRVAGDHIAIIQRGSGRGITVPAIRSDTR